MNAFFALSLLAANISSPPVDFDHTSVRTADKQALQMALASEMKSHLNEMKHDLKAPKPLTLAIKPFVKDKGLTKPNSSEIEGVAE